MNELERVSGVNGVMKWQLKDIIDLEYFLHRDAVSLSSGDQESLSERDRQIFLASVLPGVEEGEAPQRRYIIQAWLKAMREAESDHKNSLLPGEGFERLYSSLRILFALAGFLTGAAAALSFLTYSGSRPLNVFVYLTVFVASQIVILLFTLSLILFRSQKRSLLTASPLYRFIAAKMVGALLAAGKKVSRQLTADQRNRFESVRGIIMSKGRTYGFLFAVPVFVLTQLFSIGLNIGLLAATLFKIVTTDIAFGWQSTLQLSPGAVHTLIQKIALPWSWLLTDHLAFPSLAQVEGSRIILKEGIYHLSTPDLASWWPFLCLSVLFYGLLPRLFLFLGAIAAQRKLLGRIDFRQGAYEQLLLRMTTPRVTTHGRVVEEMAVDRVKAASELPEKKQAIPEESSTGTSLIVLVPDDIFDACSREEIESVVLDRFAAPVQEIIRINEDYETDSAILARFKNRDRTAGTEVMIIHEAWQPPIIEYLTFISSLRQAMGDGPCVRIGLIGKPSADTVFTKVTPENRKIWDQKIAAMGDPCIFTLGLVNDAS